MMRCIVLLLALATTSNVVRASAKYDGDDRITSTVFHDDGTPEIGQHRAPMVEEPHVYLLQRKLGEGSNGGVFLAQRLIGNELQPERFAVKYALEGAASLYDERELMRRVVESDVPNKQHVIQLMDVTDNAVAVQCARGSFEQGCTLETVSDDLVVMPLLAGDLDGWFASKKPNLFLCRESVMREIRKGMDAMHRLELAHLDMKPDNVFYGALDARGCPTQIVVADLGWTREFGTVWKQWNNEGQEEEFYEMPQYDDALWGTGNVIVSGWLDDNSVERIEVCGFWNICELWNEDTRRLPQAIYSAPSVVKAVAKVVKVARMKLRTRKQPKRLRAGAKLVQPAWRN